MQLAEPDSVASSGRPQAVGEILFQGWIQRDSRDKAAAEQGGAPRASKLYFEPSSTQLGPRLARRRPNLASLFLGDRLITSHRLIVGSKRPK